MTVGDQINSEDYLYLTPEAWKVNFISSRFTFMNVQLFMKVYLFCSLDCDSV